MHKAIGGVVVQPFAVVGGTEPEAPEGIPDHVRPGREYIAYRATAVSGTAMAASLPVMDSQFVKLTFSSVPVIEQAEINKTYRELGEALEELTQVQAGEEWAIDQNVFGTAREVASELWAHSILCGLVAVGPDRPILIPRTASTELVD
jgi:hypothetical protein